MRLGCLGIGSNAIRLLVADWDGQQLYNDARFRKGTRLFAGLKNGLLTESSLAASLSAVRELKKLADENGAERLYAFATSAVRDAGNGTVFTESVQEICGCPVWIISGEREAELSYAGAAVGGSTGVIDIGGGSTEYVFGQEEKIELSASLQMGAVRLFGERAIGNFEDYCGTVEKCSRIIREGCGAFFRMPERQNWIGVGGTMTTLGAMEKSTEFFISEICEGMSVSYDSVRLWGERLSRMNIDERKGVRGLMPQRTDIIPCGIAILQASMECFGIKTIRLSAHGNMDGFLKLEYKKLNGMRD